MNITNYINELGKAYASAADPVKAVAMKKYMKDKSEFFGIQSPQRREILRQHVSSFGLPSADDLGEMTKLCWQKPQREYQYFAMEILDKFSKKAPPEMLDIYFFMITEKSWWDTVDYIAAKLLGQYLRLYPEKIQPMTEEWMASENIWLQRSCLLFQLKYKEDTDTRLLVKLIGELESSREFFINKAIGWVLREYSKTNPRFVVEIVGENRLSGLSQREALKWMQRRGLV